MVSPEERARRGYPDHMDVPVVPDGEWVSQFDAARELGVNVFRIGALIANGHLEPAENAEGEAGVTRTSLFEELEWRRRSGWLRRLARTAGDLIRWI